MKYNPVVWFEIPVRDMDRAKGFYETVFKFKIDVHNMGGVIMGFFPGVEGTTGAMGSLMQYKSYIPSHEGPLIYFSCENLQDELDRVEMAGGKVMKEKTMISPENGYMAVMEDTEGNRIALHSSTT